MIGSSRPASADGVSSAKAKAAALETQLTNLRSEMNTLGQQYDFEVLQLQLLSTKIRDTKRAIRRDKATVVSDTGTLQQAAVNAYVNSGATASTNPLFSQNANSIGPTSVYNQVAEGNLASSVATLTNAQATLAAETTALHNSIVARTQAKSALSFARSKNHSLSVQVNSELASANQQVQAAVLAQEAAARAAAVLPTTVAPQPGQNFPAPPPNSQANIAVRAALSYLGVPYVWGGASRQGVDCSGLVMLAWDAAGVYLPHYSGAQMAASAPVPLADIQPGDLIFYGPGGSEHVTMYIGNGKMIEAPYTGAWVWITSAYFGGNFAGVGRP